MHLLLIGSRVARTCICAWSLQNPTVFKLSQVLVHVATCNLSCAISPQRLTIRVAKLSCMYLECSVFAAGRG